MTVETWKAEFYPKPASETTIAEAAEHSLQKWKGYLPENLERHEVGTADLGRANMPYRSSAMCALCEHYVDGLTDDKHGKSICPDCPLSEIGQQCLNKGSAYDLTRDDESTKAVQESTKAVQQMICALEQAVEWAKSR